MVSRRAVLGTGVGALLGACARTSAPPPLPAPPNAMIDAHCHLFNVKDLSAVRFISYVVLEHFPELAVGNGLDPSDAKSLAPEDPTFTDRLIALLLLLVGAQRAPSATAELALLQRSNAKIAQPDAVAALAEDEVELSQDAIVERIANLVRGQSFGADPQVEDRLRSILLQAAEVPSMIGRPPERITPEQSTLLAKRALAASFGPQSKSSLLGADRNLGSLFNFIAQLRRHRHALVDELTELHARNGQGPLLLAPAMVDFGRWLRDDPREGSTFAQQTAVWRQISLRPTGPAVHGYVGYCPLRQVLFDRGAFGPDGRILTDCKEDPYALVEHALNERGFLGVKLYPPMGFRPSGNVERRPESGSCPIPGNAPYPKKILKDVFGKAGETTDELEQQMAELGRLLDDALNRIYTLCGGLGAPIMAHAANSVAANREYGTLADPFFWRPVFDRPDAPAVMLAHFGGFSYVSADPEGGGAALAASALCASRPAPPDFDHSWEASLARYILANPAKPVFADISMFVEILDTAHQAPILAHFQRLKHDYADMASHLIFGSDWTMLAQDRRASRYTGTVRAFLGQVFDPGEVEAIMRRNFLRYAGLADRGASFRRVSRIYGGQPALLARLEQACAG